MQRLDETEISKAILNSYHEILLARIVSDVVIVGAGPAGLVAGTYLARQGAKVTLLEKRLAPGGGIWGGGMGMNVAVVQQEAIPVLDEMHIRYTPKSEGLYVVDAIELAAGLCFSAVQAGVAVLNLVAVEDLCVHQGQVTGVVVNRTMISGALPVDPIVLSAKAVVDATGHEAVLVAALRKRCLLPSLTDGKPPVEGPLDADSGERFVVEHVQELFPGLWITGMSVSATLGGPRMGPIFGGMLLSGQRTAQQIAPTLKA
ncbi:MAG: thiazole biosynthesis protein [Candidatus Anammoximicrobium sp.]|nr:thiazole biosynthesis protein [Candidatus Anammoximicrobium sp.]